MNEGLNQQGPKLFPSVKVPKPNYPKQNIKPRPNPKDSFKGKKVWREASAMDGEQLFTELHRRLQLGLGEVMVTYLEELEAQNQIVELAKKKLEVEEESPGEIPTDEGYVEGKTNYRAKIYSKLKKDGQRD